MCGQVIQSLFSSLKAEGLKLTRPPPPPPRLADQKPGDRPGGDRAAEGGQHLQDPGRAADVAASLLRDCNVGEVGFRRCVGDVAHWLIALSYTVRRHAVRQSVICGEIDLIDFARRGDLYRVTPDEFPELRTGRRRWRLWRGRSRCGIFL
jgi:hypothetical protein